MGIRVEHTVTKLPDSYVTNETVYKYLPSETDPKIKVRHEEVVEHRGGFLVKFMRGHSIRCFTEADLNRLGFTVKPRLIDDTSGLEVNERGIPIDIDNLVNGAVDIAKSPGDEVGGLFDGPDTGDPIEDSIKATE